MWEWIVDPAVEATDEVREALLAATEPEGLPRPALLAAKVVDEAGELHPASAPWPDIFEKEVSTAAAQRRLVSLRATRGGVLLVRDDVLARFGEPGGEVLEWSARVLRDPDNAGFLVPQAVVTRRAGGDGRLPAKMLLGDGWRLEEKLWLGVLVMQDAARSLRRAAP